MRIFILWILTALLFCSHLPAQSWFQLGTEWHYGQEYFTGPGIYADHDRMRVVADNFVGGHQAKRLDYTNNWLGVYFTEFVYEDGDRVYAWRDSVWTKLYDFNLSVGDTWWVLLPFTDPITGLDSAELEVQSTGTGLYNGVTLREQVVGRANPPAGFSYSNANIIERMGSQGFFFPVELGFIGPPYGILRCFQDSLVGLYDLQLAPTCDFSGPVVGVDDPDGRALGMEVYPQPARDVMRLRFEVVGNWQVELLDLRGRTAKSWNFVEEKERDVEVGDLPRGTYLVRGKGEEGRQGVRRVTLQ